MNLEELKMKIEAERTKLDAILAQGTMEEAHEQSVLLDGLIERYIDCTN